MIRRCAGPLRRSAALWVAVVSAACSRGVHASSRVEDQELHLFASVVTAVKERWLTGALEVTPAPLDSRSSGVSSAGAHGSHQSDVTARARRELLTRLGITVAPVASRGACPQVLMIDADRSECPARWITRIGVGLSRAGRPDPSTLPSPAPPADTSDEFRTVRVLLVSVGPAGGSESSYDFVLRKSRHTWIVVARIPLELDG
jgi:hypothetical protein